jgi:hypothetical protein
MGSIIFARRVLVEGADSFGKSELEALKTISLSVGKMVGRNQGAFKRPANSMH